MSEKFYNKVKADYFNLYRERKNTCFDKISQKYIEDFKGVPEPTEFRMIDV